MHRILVVDDDRTTLSMIRLQLESAGYAVDTATDGASGLSRLQRRRYDLVLLDVWMPGLGGIEVLGRIRGLAHAPKVVVMTADDHGSPNVLGRFDILDALSPAGCSVDDWDCLRGTAYIYLSSLTASQASSYQSQGFEIAPHIDTGCADYTPASLASIFSTQLSSFAAKFSSVLPPATNRTHCVVWSDWATQAKVALNNGVRLDTTYYYWPSQWVNNRPGLFTGSGLPMRFADMDGTLIDVYQATTQMTDESGQTYPDTIDALLNRALGPEGYYGAYVANIHTDGGAMLPFSEAILASAQARQVTGGEVIAQERVDVLVEPAGRDRPAGGGP